MKTIKYDKQAKNFILSQGAKTAVRIFHAINQLPLGNVKHLKVKRTPPLLRLRVGDYRIVFTVDGETYNILIAGNRGEVYRYISKL
ncbi:MAG: type II toxin-antitoxin system RelE/ParE family toxin [Defluviitaleaceae bacterium]|nr:type II toxin-antitoxin system RelE/ParE family toxin [Defluviitaleaceae bacterium]